MRENAKSTLLTFAYFGMIIVMLALIVSLVIGLSSAANDIAGWVKVTFITISVLLAVAVVLDVISLFANTDNFIIGYIVSALTIASIIASFVLYSRLTTAGGILPLANLNYFIFEAGNLMLIALLTVGIYIAGCNLRNVDNKTTTRTINK